MKLCDLIYNYAQYCRVNVDATLLVENWTDEDYDEEYAHYLQEYIRLKPKLDKSTNIGAAVSVLQKERVKETYEKIFVLMVKGLRSIHTMSQAKIDAIRERLHMNEPVTGEIDFSFIREARKIEEEEY